MRIAPPAVNHRSIAASSSTCGRRAPFEINGTGHFTGGMSFLLLSSVRTLKAEHTVVAFLCDAYLL